ncbi:MAG: antibiotic biosynthesis monooxygenase [Candidatus Tectomicrobia bacterium]|uniref:Antibiotic biosynthesis monooxygenase n=1 Tax=Tectimicrobiota bacterium TaxID=2528274 RepID=A0A932GRJ0_UNCTE|nr:antibiotic biosynthesis monooxygenase [Candidatus Tectomicrobia bacterium]
MSNILRFIVVKASPEKAAEIERLWKQECGPLMIKRPGCLREELLRCREDPGEYISVSEWESQQAIDAYRTSPEHEEIKRHTRGATGMAATVKTYELVGG